MIKMSELPESITIEKKNNRLLSRWILITLMSFFFLCIGIISYYYSTAPYRLNNLLFFIFVLIITIVVVAILYHLIQKRVLTIDTIGIRLQVNNKNEQFEFSWKEVNSIEFNFTVGNRIVINSISSSKKISAWYFDRYELRRAEPILIDYIKKYKIPMRDNRP